MADKLQMDVHVLDADICRHCKQLEITDTLNSFFTGLDVYFTGHIGHILACRHLSECKYKRDLFASSTTTNMET